MPARPIGSSSISFGLVAIPVQLFSATEPKAGLSFNLLDAETKSRLKQQYVRPSDGQIIGRNDMVKGYEFTKGQFVTFKPDELKALEEKSTHTIDITEFVPIAEIDPIYYDKPYYLAPEQGGEKAYRLLTEVMKETGRSAIARYAARGKQYLVLIRPVKLPGGRAGNGLIMQQLLYEDEVRPFSEVPIPEVEVKMSELQLARQLVEPIASQTFEPTKYTDEVRERIMRDIQRKIDGQDIETTVPETAPAQIIDLMEALKASLGAQKSQAFSSASPNNPQAVDKSHDSTDRRPARRSETGAEDDNAEADENNPQATVARNQT